MGKRSELRGALDDISANGTIYLQVSLELRYGVRRKSGDGTDVIGLGEGAMEGQRWMTGRGGRWL